MKKLSFAFALMFVFVVIGNVADAATPRRPRRVNPPVTPASAMSATLAQAPMTATATETGSVLFSKTETGKVVTKTETVKTVFTKTVTGNDVRTSWTETLRWYAIGDKCKDIVLLGARFSGNNSLEIQSPPLGFEYTNPKFGNLEIFLDANLSERWTLEAALLPNSVMCQKISYFGSSLGEVGINLQPIVVMKLYPFGNHMFRPYVAYGVTEVKLNGAYQVGGESFRTTGNGWKGVLRAGLDTNIPWEMFGKWSVVIDYKYEPVKFVTNLDDVGAPPIVAKFGDHTLSFGVGIRL